MLPHHNACMLLTFQRTRPTLHLALQGGGAHGAFTWGVLDAFLEDGRLRFDGVSGTSAGAMNAVALAHGLMVGGADGAREALQAFWRAVARSLPFEVAVTTGEGPGVRLAPGLRLLLQWSHYFSPEQLNPFDLNPLRDVLSAQIDFSGLRTHSPLQLFIAATQVNTGKLRLFRNAELSVDAVLASACLPTMHRTVVIEGEPYWDGGYAANPAVFPLIESCVPGDILLVMLSPLKYRSAPVSAQDIRNRMMELAFSATFLREMRMFAHLQAQVRRRWWPMGPLERRLARTRFHAIEASELLGALESESKLAASLQFFEALRQLGRTHAQQWLATHASALGRRSSIDVSALFY